MTGCGCACSSGGFCGGCGHAGCGGRARAALRDNRSRYGFAWTPQALARADCPVWLGHADDEGGEHKCRKPAGHAGPHDARRQQ